MKAFVCEHCGGDEFVEKDGYTICLYCKTKYKPTGEDKDTNLSLTDDVQGLLHLCKSDPINKEKYISLILDIDPTNTDVYKF